MLSYSTDGIASYATPEAYGTGVGFSGQAGVYSPQNKRIAASWASMWSGDFLNSLRGAKGVFASIKELPTGLWSGIGNDGTPDTDNNCQDWSASGSGQSGVVGTTESGTDVIDSGVDTCDKQNVILCACITGDGQSRAPPPSDADAPHSRPRAAIKPRESPSPTLHPTHYHVTKSPTRPTHHPTTPPPTPRPTPDPTPRPTPKPTPKPTVPPIQRLLRDAAQTA